MELVTIKPRISGSTFEVTSVMGKMSDIAEMCHKCCNHQINSMGDKNEPGSRQCRGKRDGINTC